MAETPGVLLVHDEYGKFKGGNSSINRKVLEIIKEYEPDLPVVCTVLKATEQEIQDAQNVGVTLLLPELDRDDYRTPSLDWLTFDHRSKYPHLPATIRSIVGHAGFTSRAAVRIKQERYPDAKVILVTNDIPEDTAYYKGDEKAMGIGKKEDSILEDAQEADVVFSLGKKIFNHFENQFRAIPTKKRPQHVKFAPRSSKTFEDAEAEYKEAETMVVLSIGQGGCDLAAKALDIVAEKRKVKSRVIGVDKDEFQTSQAILKSAKVQTTLLPYGTQKDICKEMMQAHLVLMPSRAEPFGLLGLEAIAAGVPVLVSSRSGLADFIHEHVDDLRHSIVDMDESEEGAIAKHLAKDIERMLKHNKAEFKTAARCKQQLLSTKYWEDSHQQFIKACTDAGGDSQPAKVKKRRHSAGSIGEDSESMKALKAGLNRTISVDNMVILPPPFSHSSLKGLDLRIISREDQSYSRAEVGKLQEEDETLQKHLLQKTMEIQGLQGTNKDMAVRIDELSSAKHTMKGKKQEEEKPAERLSGAEGKTDTSDKVSKGDQAAAQKDEETWKGQVNGRIGIIGTSGAGKSTFINSFRGLRFRDPGAASVGTTETTSENKEYSHPVYENVTLVDFPGVQFRVEHGSFHTDEYIRRFEKSMKECDVFLVFTSNRVHDKVVWIASKARAMGKKVLFVRSKFDRDVEDIQYDDPEYFADGQEEGEKRLLQMQRHDYVSKLESMGYGHVDMADVFVISGILRFVLQGRWDAPALEHAILKHLTQKELTPLPSPKKSICVLS
ncbi:uncharacterized protein [Branchiostoma lanceolatum]|uniref:uncharacterized protein n=1 Tax=Branchiostoma lanceolatum TaxID=7740 RepID=UPI003453BF95